MLDKKVQKMIDDHMQKGYSHLMKGDSISACIEWEKVWDIVVAQMDEQNYASIEDIDKEFNGRQCIYNWASDYEAELGNATRDDILCAQKRIEFCGEYVKRYQNKNDFNIGNMKRAIADSYFMIRKREEGENLYKEYLEENPNWGWGWIGWSDAYWLYAQQENKNSEKAINILKQALEIKSLEDRGDVLERLKDIYEDLGMRDEADSIVINTKLPGNLLNKMGVNTKTEKAYNEKKLVEVLEPNSKRIKVGRNEPCPCGSGKKYKKCCGA